MENLDIRWVQRFQNYRKALLGLRQAVALSQVRELTDLEAQGLIQGFEYTHELAWKTMKDFLENQGFVDVIGSRDATRIAFREGLITDGEGWMDMIKSRNLSLHTYQEQTALMIKKNILGNYFPLFEAFAAQMEKLLPA
jgi:nucleotidyltransferase substrate binding protein (TIGR01987 family)